jgi:DNA-binding transcriptional MocR family regulator
MKAPTPDALSRWLLVVLADHANEDGKCWPSQATLARRTGMGRSTVNRKLEMLEENQLIHRISGNSERSTMYHLLVPEQDRVVPERDKVVPERDTKLPLNNNTLSDDWRPSEELVATINQVAMRNNQEINHDIETAKFIAHHQSTGKRLKDFKAAYRKWCYNTVSFATRNGTSKNGSGGYQQSSKNEHGRRWRSFISSVGNKTE